MLNSPAALGLPMRAPFMPPPQMSMRSRYELSTRDLINANQYEHWQTDGAAGINNRKDVNAQAAFNDQMPGTARTDRRSFLQARTYDAAGAALADNPYFQKYDVASDPRNVARELRGAVFESPEDRGLAESNRILERQFTSQVVSAAKTKETVEDLMSARARLMPAMNEMGRIYPKTINGWGAYKCDSAPSNSLEPNAKPCKAGRFGETTTQK